MSFEKFGQWYIAIIGSIGFFMIAVGNPWAPWGFVLTFTTEPFWFITAWRNKQFGVFTLTLIYTISCVVAIWKNFFLA
ncbi:MAG: hypothetical protein COV29_00545 [Candidatus Yanofskybacteria bacterium CG10_big_fil_rev_8_21_14_0_10_36_16]|uniref:Uncharacterized protein n=1 Tax=Candidatus Yanofskybacteria bacterium CG10_big_fil_rev_8_21_14_0_10_36_16 TaxID=1975096 RepID=A0A2J0Q8C2_9BACT|nr:MAG: hypothetical protein COV29_00545 [Candidatus Yanofskybacteria bacterium CG10_big_fil_rev_8_21_14_0_10_36_16]